ncbi:MAG: TonB-dependent receptor plug domain-containing protein, partial [bacterium]
VQILQENVTIRGSDGYTYGIGSRVLVMIDGVPIMNSDFGKVNWFMVSPADIERAEIVRGAGSALYGSSAMGGVVNFITRGSSPKSRTFIRAIIGAYDDHHEPDWNWAAHSDSILHFNRQDFTHSRQIGNLGLRISGGRSYSTGYTDHGEYERYNLSGKIDYRFPNASILTLFANYMHDDSDVFVFWDSQREATRVARDERDKHQTQNGLSLFTKYRLPISSKAALEFRAFYNRFLLGTQFVDVSFSPALGLGGAIQGNFIPTNSLSIIYGSDFKFDKVESDTTFYGKRDAILAAPYFQVDWRLHRNVNLTLGGRYDRYEIYSDLNARFSEGRKYEHFSPKFGLNVHPFENTTVRGAVSNGFKFPVVFQLFFEDEFGSLTLLRNPDLRSEVSWSYELGFRQKITPTWFVEVNGFYTKVDDLIEPQPIEQSSRIQFINIKKVRIPGIELVSNGRWWDNRIGLKVNFTYMNPQDKIKKQLLNYRQKFIAFIAPSLRAGDVEFQVDYKYASAQENYGTLGIHQLVPQKVLDARIFFYWKNFTFLIGVNNMFNYEYTLRDKFLEENRNFVAGLTAEF